MSPDTDMRKPLFAELLDGSYDWYREVPWWDLEILPNGGASDDGLGTAERVPAPTTVSFGVRVRF